MNVSLEANDSRRAPTDRLSLELPMLLSIAVAVLVVASSLVSMIIGTGSAGAGVAGHEVGHLLAAVPLLIVALRLAHRGSLVGQLLWMGSLFHVASSYAVYVLGTRISPALGAYVAIVALSMYALLDLLVDIDAVAVKQAFAARTPTRVVAGFLALISGALLWSSGASTVWHAGPTPLSNFVELLDRAVLIPALLCVGVLLWRRRPWGFVLAGVLLPKAALLSLSWTIAAASAFVRGDATSTFAALALTGACVAATMSFLRSIERTAAPLPALRS